jgi:hypothetical protein
MANNEPALLQSLFRTKLWKKRHKTNVMQRYA